MGTERKGMQGRFDVNKKKNQIGVVEDPFQPPQRTLSKVINRVGEVEITPRQEQKVVPRGGVHPSHNPQLSTESSNNTEVKGIVAPILTSITKKQIIAMADTELAVSNSVLKAQVRQAQQDPATAVDLIGDMAIFSPTISEDTLASQFKHVQTTVANSSTRGGNPKTQRHNKFSPTPRPPTTSNGVDQNRVSYSDLNLLFQNKFQRNKLYFDHAGNSGFNLVAYNITMFTLPSNVVLGHRINEVSMKGFNAYNNAIIIAQSAGTDEFYIENLSFNTTIGKAPDEGTGTQPTDISVTIKSPTNNDFIDLLIKSAIVGGWENHTKMPMFIHVEWNGRSTVDDAPVKQINKIFRCFPIILAKAGASTMDEGGSSYEFKFTSARATVFNNMAQKPQEDIIVSGYTVGEILAQITTEMYKLETNGRDVHLVPDEVYIEFPEKTGGGINKIKDYLMVTGERKNLSNVAGQRGEAPDKASGKAVEVDVGTLGGAVRDVHHAPLVSDTQTKAKAAHSADLKKSIEKVTFTAPAGESLTNIIIKLVSNTVEGQAMISGVKDPSAMKAPADAKNVDPTSILREFIQIESDVIFKEYDVGRRKYATKNFIKVFEHEAPSYSVSQQGTTTQTKGASVGRLEAMLSEGFISKCYHHMYTGLNTEIKNLEWTFDNLIFTANQLYSGIVAGYQQRQHGVRVGDAKQGAAHLGFADKGLMDMRILEENEKESAKSVKTAETEFEAAKKAVGGPPGTANQTGVLLAAALAKLKAEQKRHDSLVIDLQESEVIAQLRGTGAKISNKVKVVDTSGMGHDAITGLLKGLGPNARAFQKGDGKMRIITWEPASLPVALGKNTFLNDLNDSIVEDAIDQGVMFPQQFASAKMGQTEQGGLRVDHDKGKNIFAEIYQNTKMHMMNVNMTIRGDPYWWPKIYQGKQFDKFGKDVSVTPSVMESYLIIIADQSNTYDPGTGVMEIRQRNSMNGVYGVRTVAHNFADGEYTQELTMYRDGSIDLNKVFGGKSLADAARQSRTNANSLDF